VRQFRSVTVVDVWETRMKASVFYRTAAVLLLLFAAGHVAVQQLTRLKFQTETFGRRPVNEGCAVRKVAEAQ
jgi:hypothetical protein